MRFGIHLPSSGVLSEPAALTATAVAADQLGYATVWAAWLGQLAQVAAVTDAPALGWILDEAPGATALRPSGLRPWAGRLAGVMAPRTAFAWLRSGLPGALLLDTTVDPSASSEDTGWAPSSYPGPGPVGRWRARHRDCPLVLRWDRAPTREELAEIHDLGVDEVVVATPRAVSLDDQLATFARVAETVAGLTPA